MWRKNSVDDSNSPSFKQDLAVIKKKLSILEQRGRAQEDARQLRQQQEEEVRRVRERQAREVEEAARTRKFFTFNCFDHPVFPLDGPTYQGGLEARSDAWRPHGEGCFLVGDEALLRGRFHHGAFGEGEVHSRPQEIWQGGMNCSALHGPGHLNGQEVLLRHNEVICSRDDLVPGTQIALWGERMAQSERVMVTILRHVSDWNFLCRYHEEVVPRQRVINLAALPNLEVVKHLPLIHIINEDCKAMPTVSTPTVAMKGRDPVAASWTRRPPRTLLPCQRERHQRSPNIFRDGTELSTSSSSNTMVISGPG